VFIFQKVAYGFKELLYGSIALIPVLIFFKVQVSIRVIEVIPLLLLATTIITGIGVILAIGYVFFADIEYLYYVFMSLMIFISGVFIPIDHLPDILQKIMGYNPIFLTIYIFRNALVYNLPSHWSAWVKLLIWAIGLIIVSHSIYEAQRDKCVNKL
jgi:lipopolysaccharide transport system permease protein